MYKNRYIKSIILLILLVSVLCVLISASSAARYEPTKKIDAGNKIIKVNNTKYKIKWETDQVTDQDKKNVYITYRSMKNKKDNGYLYIDFYKVGKKKITISKYSSSMILGTTKTIKIKTNTNNYYWKKLRPKIANITKNSILNKPTIKYNEIKYFNRTIRDYSTEKNVTNQYKMNWIVYYYSKMSSIELTVKYTDLSNLNKSYPFNRLEYIYDSDIRIDKYAPGKLKLTISPYTFIACGSSTYYKYVKTNLTPKQYYLKVYKKQLETKNRV